MTVTENAPSPDAPRWDVSKYFPGVDSREYTDAEEQIGARVGRLAALYDRHDVRRGSLPDDPATAIDEVLADTNEVLGQLGQMRAYLNAFVSTDSTDSVAQANDRFSGCSAPR